MSSVKSRNLLRDGCSPPTWLHQEIENKNHGIDIRRNPFAIIWLNSLRLDSVGDRSAEDMGTSLDAELSLESSAFMKETWTPLPIKCNLLRLQSQDLTIWESNASTQTSVPRSHNMESNMHLRPPAVCIRWGFFQVRPPFRRSWLLPLSFFDMLLATGGGFRNLMFSLWFALLDGSFVPVDGF